MQEEQLIKFEGKTVSVRMMDEDYIVSDCPQQPEHIETMRKRNSKHCACMGARGVPIRDITSATREQHGNCAVLAWDGDVLVGILTFFPVEDLIERKAEGWEVMVPYADSATLAIGSCVLCSLAGRQYGRKGIGRAMAELMIDWAKESPFRRVGAFDLPSGNDQVCWGHACRPPRPFWEKLGFRVVGEVKSTRDWEKVKSGFAKQVEDAKETGTETWRIKTFTEYIRQVESSELSFADFDAHCSLIRDL